MITRVIFSNSANGQIVADLIPDPSNKTPGYLIESIDGLGPVGSTLSSFDTPGADGVSIHRSRPGQRNLVFNLAHTQFSVGASVELLREDFYSKLTPGSKINVQLIRSGKPTLTTEGVIESVEPDIFTATPTLNVSVVCGSPYFMDGSLKTATVKNQTQLDAFNKTLGSAPTEFEIRWENLPAGTNFIELRNGTDDFLRFNDINRTSTSAVQYLLAVTFAGIRKFSSDASIIYNKTTGTYGLALSKSKPLSVTTGASTFQPFTIKYYTLELGV